MIKIKQEFADVLNNVVEQVITTVLVPDGHTYEVQEINALVEVDTIVYFYIEDERVCIFKGDVNARDTRRNVVNWILPAGSTLKVTASNTSGATHELGCNVTYDDKS